MSRIQITEKEEVVTKVLDVTENTVAIPMLYCRDFKLDEKSGTQEYIEDLPKAKLYTNLTTFKNELFNKAPYVTDVVLPETTPHYKLSDLHKDKSYTMAYELLLAGLNVIVKPLEFDSKEFAQEVEVSGRLESKIVIGPKIIVSNKKCNEGATKIIPGEEEAFKLVSNALTAGSLDDLKDKNLYNIKFITAGGYPSFGRLHDDDEYSTAIGIHAVLVDLAKTRGDAVALLDLREEFKDKNELLTELQARGEMGKDYAYSATFFPWCKFNVTSEGVEKVLSMPAGFAYLMAYANSIKSNANWFAASGKDRGVIPNMVAPNFDVGEALMHILQCDSEYTLDKDKHDTYSISNSLGLRVNPIYNAGTYGYRIWGNMCTAILQTAGSQRFYREFLNVRILLCDIIKTIYHSAMATMFEPDDDITWLSFKSRINTSILEKAKTGRGLKWYKWTKQQPEDKAELVALLEVRPIEAIDSIKVNLTLTAEEAIVSEEE